MTVAPEIHSRCGMLDDPDEGRPCPCRAWIDEHGDPSLVSKQVSKAHRAAVARARRTDDIAVDGSGMSDLERKLGDALADERITGEDAEAVRTFAQFLTESGPAPTRDGERFVYPRDHPLGTREACDAHKARWMPYMQGEADGPVEEANR